MRTHANPILPGGRAGQHSLNLHTFNLGNIYRMKHAEFTLTNEYLFARLQ